MLAGVTLGVFSRTPHISLKIDELQDETQSLLQARMQVNEIDSESATQYNNADDGKVSLSFHVGSIDGPIPTDEGITITVSTELSSTSGSQVNTTTTRGTNVTFLGFNSGLYDVAVYDRALDATFSASLNIGYDASPSYIRYKNANYPGTGSIYFLPILSKQKNNCSVDFTITNVRTGFAAIDVEPNHLYQHGIYWSNDKILVNGSILYTGRNTNSKANGVTFTQGEYTVTTNAKGVVTLTLTPIVGGLPGRDVDLGNFNGYVTTGFPLTALFVKNCGLLAESIPVIKSALDHWSNILRYTTLPEQTIPADIYNGQAWVANPLAGRGNKGYVVCINRINLGSNNTLAAASYWYIRNTQNTSYYWLPSIGFFFINAPYESAMLNNVTAGGKTELYNTVLHEMGHAFGLGTAWFYQNNGVLHRSFVVNAGDQSANPTHGELGNIFYATDRGNNSRNSTQVGTLIENNGDASYTFAYNPYSTTSNRSVAVSAYNIVYNTNLSAIPLENGMGAGSYGGHWHEGLSTINGGTGDERQYYGVTYPGAPSMQDELMTPISEGTIDVPLSKITLGAMVDLGWTVDFALADTYEPFVLKIKRSTVYLDALAIKRNNYGGYIEGYDGSEFEIFQSLRRGQTYTIKNETTDTLGLYPIVGGSLGPEITANIVETTQNGTPCILWTIPTTFTAGSLVVLRGTRNRDIIALLID